MNHDVDENWLVTNQKLRELKFQEWLLQDHSNAQRL